MIEGIQPHTSWENDGTTITVIKRYPLDIPPEWLQHEYERTKHEFGAALLEAIERTKSKCVVDYEEESYGVEFRYNFPAMKSFRLTAVLKPVQYMSVTYPAKQYVEPSLWWIKSKPRTLREKLSKWISGK